jgi:riboflavin kinase/FMN adenylyltransferase
MAAMRVIYSIENVEFQRDSIVTVGTFDGLHHGHRAIIQEVVARASSPRARSVVVTFEPHPREVVGRGPVKLLSTLDERLVLLEQFGIDVTLVVKFTYEFSRLTSREFYERIVVNGVGAKEVIEGHDHMFGRDREGDVAALGEMGKEFGFTVTTVNPVSIDGEPVSSSKIRETLMRGKVDVAEKFLSRPYSLETVVVKGDGRGAGLGFPTANLQPVSEKKLIPAEGVYLVGAVHNGRELKGMLNIGVRPTFTSELNRVIEVHLFDFNEEIYGNHLTVRFLKQLRQEKKFSSKEELIAQLHHDKKECMRYIDALQLSSLS